MIVHRDYRESSHSIIKIFDDRIEFYNPGRLYGNLTVADLLSGHYISQTRNKLIAKAFKEAGLIERYGSGIKRIINICKDNGIIDPVFEEKPNGFMVTIFKEKPREADVTENVTETRYALILDQIRLNEKITVDQLANIFNINRRTIIRDIEKLKEEGKIKRIGPAKGGHWQIIEK